MWISDFAIRRPVITIVAMLVMVIFGAFAWWQLDTDEFPEVNPPVVSVAVPYPGASPDIVEREVMEPMEEGIAAISGVDRITSQSLDGFGIIIVEFVFDKDLQQATQDIRDQISQIRGDLPLEMEEPILTRFDPNDLPIVSLALTSERLGSAELTRIAETGITRELRGLSGVADVSVAGGIERELTVELNPQAVQAAGVSVGQIVQTLQTQNLAVPVGRLNGELDERTIRLRGRLERPEDFAEIAVSQSGGRLVRLGEVATVRDATEEQRTIALFNGEEAVGIDITKAQGYSTTAVSERVLAQIGQIQEGLPEGVVLRVVKDAGERVDNSVRNVQEALLEGALLTIFTVFLFLNSWRSTVITGLALPVSVLASFIAVWAFGFTLNTMSLLGLSLAVGILIDDAIVVRENIVRHVEMGKDHYQAAQEGTAEIGLAVTATTFSIVVVFLPIAFMGGIAEQWFAPFALTIACAVLVSLFVSFSLDPMLSAYWPEPEGPVEKMGRFDRLLAPVTRVLTRFNHWFDGQAENYKRVIGWALDHRLAMVLLALGTFLGALMIPVKGITGFAVVLAGALAVWMVYRLLKPWAHGRSGWGKAGVVTAGLLLAAVVIGVTAFGIGVVPPIAKLGGEFFPEQDVSEFNIIIETPPGSNLAYTRLKAQEAARLARAKEETAYTYTTIAGQTSEVDRADVYVRLVPKGERDRHQTAIQNELRAELGRIGGATVAMSTGNFGGEKQIALQLRGPDVDVLNQLAAQVMAEVREVPGAVDIDLSTKGQKPELDVRLNRGLASSLGITAGQVAQSLRPAFAGIDVGDWIDPQGETRDVTVRLAPEARERAADLATLPLVVQGPQGPVTLPLGQVAQIEPNIGPAQINRLDRERVINVEANTAGRPLSEVVADIEARLEAIPLPPGYEITQGGETESQREVFGRIFGALGIAVLLMYFILVIQFGSFLDPVAIMISLPLSLIGVMLALLLTGSTLNLMSMIGVILLMGIVAKNAILLIDFAKWSEEAGMERREAIIEAGRVRLRPILMTTFALSAGMLPVAIGAGEGADFRAPLGRAVIGGVLSSAFLTLLVIPTFYEIISEWRDAVLHRFRPAHQAEEKEEHSPLIGAEPVPVGAGD